MQRKKLKMAVERNGYSGEIKTMQQYNFVNQLNWILTGRPQSSASEGMSIPVLVTSDQVNSETRNTFNQWIKKIDSEYKELLNRYNVGDVVIFRGKRTD